ncbi:MULTISPECIES: tRNA1(Val) (adenine(37)-N6)-methyltransferase [unclassified Marinovum]
MTSGLIDATDNAFLGGRLQILQPRHGYRAGVDPVLLAASVPARAGQAVLELGCGVGTALYCLAARVPGLALCGVDVQADYVELARENARRNGLEAEVHSADLDALPVALRAQNFDHVIANPPYFIRDASHASPNTARETGRGEALPLARWIEVAARRLRPLGHATFIQRAERLPEMLAACEGRLGALEVLPLVPRDRRPARLILLRGRKGGRTPFCLHPPVVLHQGAQHLSDGEDYAPMISAVLRKGAILPFGAAP